MYEVRLRRRVGRVMQAFKRNHALGAHLQRRGGRACALARGLEWVLQAPRPAVAPPRRGETWDDMILRRASR